MGNFQLSVRKLHHPASRKLFSNPWHRCLGLFLFLLLGQLGSGLLLCRLSARSFSWRRSRHFWRCTVCIRLHNNNFIYTASTAGSKNASRMLTLCLLLCFWYVYVAAAPPVSRNVNITYQVTNLPGAASTALKIRATGLSGLADQRVLEEADPCSDPI